MIVLIGVVIVVLVLIGISIYHAVQIYRVSQYTDVKVDGTVKTISGKTSNRLIKAYQKTEEPLIIIFLVEIKYLESKLNFCD